MTTNDPPQMQPAWLPPTAPPTSTTRWRNNRPLANVLTVLLAINAVALVVAIVFLARRLSIFSDFENNGGSFDLAQRDQSAADNVVSIAITMGILFFVTFIVFIVWMWRAAKNNEALGRTKPRFGSGWAIGGWFIPIAFFVIPVLMMQDLWRGSDPTVPRDDTRWKIADRSALIGWWWGLLIAGRVSVSVFSGNSDDSRFTISQLRTDVNLSIVSSVLSIAAAVLGVLVVRRLTERQDQCLRVQNEQWAQQSGTAPTPPLPPS